MSRDWVFFGLSNVVRQAHHERSSSPRTVGLSARSGQACGRVDQLWFDKLTTNGRPHHERSGLTTNGRSFGEIRTGLWKGGPTVVRQAHHERSSSPRTVVLTTNGRRSPRTVGARRERSALRRDQDRLVEGWTNCGSTSSPRTVVLTTNGLPSPRTVGAHHERLVFRRDQDRLVEGWTNCGSTSSPRMVVLTANGRGSPRTVCPHYAWRPQDIERL